jgi:lipoprotein-anchoring transpeptidase ErfK/SrfK
VLRAVASVAVAAGLLVTGCTTVAGRSGPPRVTIRVGNRALPPGHGLVTTSAGAPVLDRRPDLGVVVRVTGGRLSEVMLRTRSGRTVTGTLSRTGTTWHTDWALAPSVRYRVTAVAVSGAGATVRAAGDFRTVTPRLSVRASTFLGHRTYGVGMPIMLRFSSPVTDRAEVERALQIRSSKPVTGAWYWMTSRSVWFRPRKYWPADTRVRFVAHLRGVRVAPGRYGSADLSQTFRIGRSLVAVASAASHRMKVWYNGRLAERWPISTGQPGLDTPDGRYLSFDKASPVDMNSATFGVKRGQPGYYNVLVYDSVQFTFDGDYVHSAPWSVSQQGYANVSHGCVNLSPANAAWYYRHSLIGDPITVVGSPRHGRWGDGWTIWFLSWRQLLAGSATGKAVRAGQAGSRLAGPATAN